MRVLLIDNIDSFTWNIFHYLEALDADLTVKTNLTVEESDIESADCIVLSPGPGLPIEAGKLMWSIDRSLVLKKPVLGVCLGMQALAEHYGGTLYNQQEVKHGVSEIITTTPGSVLFSGLPATFGAGLYHSWAIEPESLPTEFNCTAFSESGVLMAMEHRQLPIFGVQFHPESILSEYGMEIFGNFLRGASKEVSIREL